MLSARPMEPVAVAVALPNSIPGSPISSGVHSPILVDPALIQQGSFPSTPSLAFQTPSQPKVNNTRPPNDPKPSRTPEQVCGQ
ncbi:hypothetical protein NLI96_g6376 [Meripilus lineatus]|uniref:Uncharacterized protein n=1 Tax=Meripilus lineatus TaxID=2056292 RepID=A0AAD5YDY5_9APHY|nr:hypothetical protein NLI96_g6376 [Physisporinus lineatus]